MLLITHTLRDGQAELIQFQTKPQLLRLWGKNE